MKKVDTPPSKLFIRSEVLAVVEFLTVVEDPSKQDQLKQLNRLKKIDDQQAVLDILVKELKRCTSSDSLQAISELLMELGTIEMLQDPLWELIRAEDSTDEVKDAANLTLRHLGDESNPDLYLNYLEDPHGLISRETERMLEVSSGNPEALIDFIDFIFSLPVDEQCNLLGSLQSDYNPNYLVNIYVPSLWADPPPEAKLLILKFLGQTRTPKAAVALYEFLDHYQTEEEFVKVIKHSINELKIAGIYKEESLEEYRQADQTEPHILLEAAEPYECFVTIPDGIGNQGIIISRRRENGDIAMMTVAVNDMHGIIDCFGFFQLSEADFNKIVDKFHEESTKIQVPPEYCAYKLRRAEIMNKEQHNRIPYEYTCWKILIRDFPDTPMDYAEICREWANTQWVTESANLFQHPDFQTWFLEEGDHEAVNEVLTDVVIATKEAAENKLSLNAHLATMETLGEALVRSLMRTEWKEVLLARLADSAYLLDCQDLKTFASLAATEVIKLLSYGTEDEESIPHLGFIQQYGRRCVTEQLIKLKNSSQVAEADLPYIENVLTSWEM